MYNSDDILMVTLCMLSINKLRYGVLMSMSKTFIGGAVCREFESEAPLLCY